MDTLRAIGAGASATSSATTSARCSASARPSSRSACCLSIRCREGSCTGTVHAHRSRAWPRRPRARAADGGHDGWVPNRAVCRPPTARTQSRQGRRSGRVPRDDRDAETPSTKVVVAPLLTLKASADLTKVKGVVRPVRSRTPPVADPAAPAGAGRPSRVLRRAPAVRLRAFGSGRRLPCPCRPGNGWSSALSPKVPLQWEARGRLAAAAVAALSVCGSRRRCAVRGRRRSYRVASARRQDLRAYGSVAGTSQHALLVVDGESIRGVRRVDGVRWAEWLGARSARVAFAPTDTLAAKQWYLSRTTPSTSGRSRRCCRRSRSPSSTPASTSRHPESRGPDRAHAASWAGRSPTRGRDVHRRRDRRRAEQRRGHRGHRLFRAASRREGRAATTGRSRSRPRRRRSAGPPTSGARVINLSLGGVARPDATRPRHVLGARGRGRRYARPRRPVVAAVGNGDDAPSTAVAVRELPGGAAARPRCQRARAGRSVPGFSNRDAVFNDIAAPGKEILSTFPRALRRNVRCVDQGYSDCGAADSARRRDLVRRAAGVGGRGVAARAEPGSDPGPGGDAHRALG